MWKWHSERVMFILKMKGEYYASIHEDVEMVWMKFYYDCYFTPTDDVQ